MRKSRQFSPEVQERAVRRVLDQQNKDGSREAAIGLVNGKMDCTAETLRPRVRQAEREVRQADEILRKGSPYLPKEVLQP